jgi:chemosensory pili system protein ChpA (sensor histidine kinase/response regulator)
MASIAKRVLVVEDDLDIREAIAVSLEDLGVQAIRARDGVEGLEQLAAGPAPQAILLDLCMPRLDGSGFLAAMRQNPDFAEIPVISMTAATHVPPPETSAHLHKPFDFGELAQLLASLCER